MKRIRTAVIGAGRLGGFHAQKLAKNPDVELVGVADPMAANRERVAKECGCEGLADYRELFGRIDAAVVAAPTGLHHSISTEFLQKGIHLLVEKPLCPDSSEADDLVELARRKKLVLQVGHVERFNPAFSAAIPHTINPQYIQAERASGFTFRSTDVGVVMDLMIHDIDLVLSLVGSRVRRVDATGLSVVSRYEDVANARLEFECGCVAVLSSSRVNYEASRRMSVWSSRGYTAIDFATRTTTLVRPSSKLLQGGFDIDSLSAEQLDYERVHFADEHLPKESFQYDAVDALGLEVNDFVQAVGNSHSPLVTGEAGRDAVLVAEQILDSIYAHAEGRSSGGPLVLQPTRPRHILPMPHFASPARHREAG